MIDCLACHASRLCGCMCSTAVCLSGAASCRTTPVQRHTRLMGACSPGAVCQQVDYTNAQTPSPPVVTAQVMTAAPVTTSGVKPLAPMDLTGLYAVPVKITNTTRTTVCHC
jgi:hypothetical protein